MNRVLPYPLLALSLLAMWLLLNGASAGHIVLGAAIALAAARMMSALEPAKPRIRRWSRIPLLFALVMVDIVHSNLAVTGIILGLRKRKGSAGFVAIPLAIRDRTALATLACVITATPGTAWVEYRSTRDVLLIHVLDMVEQQDWIDLVKGRYEPLLQEIFE
ncbi:Na+/H+ antiporter subunit E [Bosea sp. (in: a-proteobacteria)]|uniref:Na+/H+ antiporter subunit E n=1 Tax=Bosea sp. (in: a-proteobacteria) TaxID=1871050 RepID=UPI00263947C7|nr:Na+/H+ antiporter subunit E [Bosea sp. (in: a-proteobacteria)]MCO5090244.1 Na+/H+ antiporter subunit E [Bosea sp. (in: a-proteobacteria)]